MPVNLRQEGLVETDMMLQKCGSRKTVVAAAESAREYAKVRKSTWRCAKVLGVVGLLYPVTQNVNPRLDTRVR